MLLVGWQEGHPAWWGAGVVVCLEQGADLHMAQLMPLPLTVSCFSKIQTGFTFLVPAYPGSPGKRAIKRVCACIIIIIQCKFARATNVTSACRSICLLPQAVVKLNLISPLLDSLFAVIKCVLLTLQ